MSERTTVKTVTVKPSGLSSFFNHLDFTSCYYFPDIAAFQFFYIFIYIEDRAVVTQRITARKVECGNVRKIVARREIEMIKKRGSSGRDATNHGTKNEMW